MSSPSGVTYIDGVVHVIEKGSDFISHYDLQGNVKLNVRMWKRDELQIEFQKRNLNTEGKKNQLQVRLQQALQAQIDEHDGNTVTDVQKLTAIASCTDGHASFLYYTEQQSKQIHCAR